ncbi:MAG: efflux RND transporter periplasmic adaptor subunit [Deltaproteobacteria bacterium]|nr:efflux RND transporter periplasmic adaptor subunit [Deltaproteobacteria bacterium]
MILLLAALLACSQAPEAAHAQINTEPIDATRVEVAEMRPSEARLLLNLPGDVVGSRDATLAAALGGYVEAVRAEEGQVVRRGQALLLVDASLHKASLDQAAAQAEQAASSLVRVQAMGERASQADLERAEIASRVASAALDAAKVRYSRAVISAPFDGVVAQLDAEVGEVLAPGAPAVRLVRLDPVHVELAVSDRDVGSLTKGLAVEVELNAREGRFTGVVEQVAPAGDLKSRAFPVVVSVPNPDGGLLPGMIAQVKVDRLVQEQAMVLPQSWLVTNLDSRGVYVEEGGVAHWRPLVLGAVVRDEVIVASGLSEGDRVITTGQRELLDGDPILVSREAWCCAAGRQVPMVQR